MKQKLNHNVHGAGQAQCMIGPQEGTICTVVQDRSENIDMKNNSNLFEKMPHLFCLYLIRSGKIKVDPA